MEEFLQILRTSLDERSFVSLTLSRPVRADDQSPRRVVVRPVEIRGQLQWQWTSTLARREQHENLDACRLVDRVAGSLRTVFRHAHLFTASADVSLRIDSSGRGRLAKSPPSKSPGASMPHDRPKNYLIPEGRPCAFLHELGVMTAEGRVHRARQAKFRQINRFLEFVQDIMPHLPPSGPLEVVDFGCGLSYLTFALHYLLTAVHERTVHLVGVDQNAEVIGRCRETCRRLGWRGLEFVAMPITALPAERKAHLTVSLHACDTATDDALAQSVRLGADVILAAPCCQHELAPQLEGEALVLLTRHGILRERLAALATDALRGALLEQAGYRTSVIEFIETEHTPKNLLLRGVRAEGRDSSDRKSQEIARLKALLGVKRMRLEELLIGAASGTSSRTERGSGMRTVR